MKFKAKHNGEIYDFPAWEVEGMRKHPDYEEVKEDEVEEPVVKRGRPAKKDAEE